MKIIHTIKIAAKALKTNRSRSALTILGIVIGITAIMMVMSLGQGAQNLILGEIQGIGSKTIAVLPGRAPEGFSDVGMVDSLFSDSLKQRDLDALRKKSNVPHGTKIMPIVFGNETLSYGNEIFRGMIIGATEEISDIYDTYPEAGAFFTNDDALGRASIVVIGHKVKEELFGEEIDDEEVIGEKIKMAGKSFRVVGVLPHKGEATFVNFDETVFTPYTTAQTYILGIKHFNRIVVEADEEENVDATVKDIEITLREMHGISDPDKDDFYVNTQGDILEMVGTVTNVLKFFLAAVAAISLLVGGVGIMNIMLVSVTERTREIGLRKAIGATSANVLTQFLIESVLLTATGGFIGIMLGSAFSFLVAFGLSKALGTAWLFTFPVGASLLGLGVSGAVGLIFGLYPARKAASKSPIEALRYE